MRLPEPRESINRQRTLAFAVTASTLHSPEAPRRTPNLSFATQATPCEIAVRQVEML